MNSKHNREVLEVFGEDSTKFLQGIITNDMGRLDQGPIYTAILTPQGKYFIDFFIVPLQGRILIDTPVDGSEDLINKLLQYRLRAKVDIKKNKLKGFFGSR